MRAAIMCSLMLLSCAGCANPNSAESERTNVPNPWNPPISGIIQWNCPTPIPDYPHEQKIDRYIYFYNRRWVGNGAVGAAVVLRALQRMPEGSCLVILAPGGKSLMSQGPVGPPPWYGTETSIMQEFNAIVAQRGISEMDYFTSDYRVRRWWLADESTIGQTHHDEDAPLSIPSAGTGPSM